MGEREGDGENDKEGGRGGKGENDEEDWKEKGRGRMRKQGRENTFR